MKYIVFFHFLFLCSMSFGQQINFTGNWVLIDRISIVGPDYANGVPGKLKIIEHSDSVTIESESKNLLGLDTIMNKTLYFDNRPVVATTSSNNVKTTTTKRVENKNGFTESILYSEKDGGKYISTTTYDWTIDKTKKTLTLIRQNEDLKSGQKWIMKGIYYNDEIGNGVVFQNNLSWNQIKEKAKIEGKYIFVDCYTTWCGPCKKMEEVVYSLGMIGKYMNQNYVSVKIQMDTTINDNELVHSWYQTAQDLVQKYQVNVYPTYLFFSPNGEIVHRDFGFKKPFDFLSLAKDAMDTSKEYYRLVQNYKEGKKEYQNLAYLALTEKEFGDQNFAYQIATDYKDNYLNKLSPASLCTKENLQFIHKFADLVQSSDGFFNLFYNYSGRVDSIMAIKGLSNFLVKKVITTEELESKLWRNGMPRTRRPNWNDLQLNIRKKYNDQYAQVIVSEYLISYYERISDWKEYARSIEQIIKKYPPDSKGESLGKAIGYFGNDAFCLNHCAWKIFENCSDKSVLEKALVWSDTAIKLVNISDPKSIPMYLDTRANLLYKLGMKKDAIECEQKALLMWPDWKDAQYTLDKMKKGEPTWTARN